MPLANFITEILIGVVVIGVPIWLVFIILRALVMALFGKRRAP